MVTKEILTLIFLVLIFLGLVSWTSVTNESFENLKDNDILQKFSNSKKEWSNMYKVQSQSQSEQDRRLKSIDEIASRLENQMEKLRDNVLIGKSGATKINKECKPGDPLCIMPNKYQYYFKRDHFSKNLS